MLTADFKNQIKNNRIAGPSQSGIILVHGRGKEHAGVDSKVSYLLYDRPFFVLAKRWLTFLIFLAHGLLLLILHLEISLTYNFSNVGKGIL
jgi:hypothetical protein